MLDVTQCEFCNIQLLTKPALFDVEGNYLPKCMGIRRSGSLEVEGFRRIPASHMINKFCCSISLLIVINIFILDFSGASSGKEPGCQCRRLKGWGFDPWVWKISWRRAWQPTLVFLPGESHGQRGWWATVQRVTKNQTQLKQLSMHHYINIL